uniref:Uncharacterized protein n=1 Tax=Anguilla anguilla TaxID=7936 RepID=A0A0E9TS12_ANGAN
MPKRELFIFYSGLCRGIVSRGVGRLCCTIKGFPQYYCSINHLFVKKPLMQRKAWRDW